MLQEFQRELLAGGSSSESLSESLKEAENELKSYFEHPDMLAKVLGAGGMTYEPSFLRAKRSESWVGNAVRDILFDLRNALRCNEALVFKTWSAWVKTTDRAIANVGAVAILEAEKGHLDPHLQVKCILREMADLLEGSLKIFAQLRLKMLEIAGARNANAKPLENLTFGEIVEELVKIATNGQVYCPLPFNISASQWRNIAHHNSYDTKGDLVTCTYGPAGKHKSFTCFPKDIFAVACYFGDLCYVHKVAIEIFGVDNAAGWAKNSPDLTASEFTMDAALAFGLVSAGFEICYATQTGNMWRLALKDERERDRSLIKAALQEAVLSYTLMGEPTRFEAAVYSPRITHRIGFISSISTGQNLPSDFQGDVFRLDKQFRIIPKAENQKP